MTAHNNRIKEKTGEGMESLVRSKPGRKTVVNKWLFYVFYPLHLILIWLILKA